jgi:hypothetical protein
MGTPKKFSKKNLQNFPMNRQTIIMTFLNTIYTKNSGQCGGHLDGQC